MARNLAGSYALPAGSLVTDGVDDILASQHNTPLQDIAADLNLARPVVAGGTGADNANRARANLGITPDDNENRIINGNFLIWQRGTSFSTSGYGADRWFNGFNGGTATQSLQSFTIGETLGVNSPYYFLRQAVSGQTLSGHYATTSQRIEYVRTYAGQTITVMGWAKRGSGTGNMVFEAEQFFGTGGSPSAAVSGISSTTVTLGATWAPFAVVVNVPSITGKTLGTNNNDFLNLNFWISGGSDFNARNNSLGLQTIGVDYWGIHIRVGAWTAADVPLYCQRDPGTEYTLCQRYCSIVYVHAQSASTGFVLTPWYTPVTMRKTPAVTVTAAGTAANAVAASDSPTNANGGYFQMQALAANGSVADRIYRCDAEL